MKLIIVESPTKARTIQRYLGKDYKIVASQGHVRDLSLEGKGSLGVDVDNDFEPDYVVSPRGKKTISYIKKISDDADEVYLATDPDREGEAIAWHLADELDLDVNKTKRLVFHEITKRAVNEALENPRLIDMNLVKSQETRRILDRIIGFELSGLLQRKIHTRSAGRVQSVALRLIVEKEKEITNFKEETTYGLEATLNKEKIKLELVDDEKKKIRLEKKDELEKLLDYKGKELTLQEIETEEIQRYPYPPFTTSSLQQDAFHKFRFSASKTNRVAQKLYEGVKLEKGSTGLITYMRTDSIRLGGGFVYATREYINENYGEDYLGFAKKQKENSRVQDAHEAIRPTQVENTPESVKKYLTKDEFNLYKLIWTRAVASIMKHSVVKNTDAIFVRDGNKFLANGQELVFDGYKKLYGEYENNNYVALSELKEGEQYLVDEIEVKEHKTKPPYRYSEGSLIKTMEELGIGRPSTYASTIESLKKSWYVEVQRGYIHPTTSGLQADEKLLEFFENIINVNYTANMENQLDKIAEGEMDRSKALGDFYKPFKEKVNYAYKNMTGTELEKIDEECPKCHKSLVKRHGRYGEYITCEDRPNCDYIKKKEKVIPEDAPECPTCKEGKLLIRKGRYGEFYGCSNFPKCKHIEKIEKKK
ncbi:TPA: type I DNA topoisomerase [bacterium]|nr:type I DNA topoisomerase [bacterium]